MWSAHSSGCGRAAVGPSRFAATTVRSSPANWVDLWAYQHQVRIDYSRPGKPTDNAFVESFNGTFRDECLNAHWFESIADARAVVESWRVEYNESRPHRALGEVPPAEFARRFRARPEPTGQPDAEDSHRHWH